MTGTSHTAILTGPYQPAARPGAPGRVMVLLHGVGADGQDLIGLAPMLAQHLPDCAFHAPNAPQRCDMVPYGYQWFSLLDRRPEPMLAGAEATAPTLHRYLDALQADYGLPPEKIILLGFSQGCMMSLLVGPQRTGLCGIVGYSGMMLGGPGGNAGVKSRPPVCLIHGDRDEVLPVQAMSVAGTGLRTAGLPVETHVRPGLGHGIDPEGIYIGIDFLKRLTTDTAA